MTEDTLKKLALGGNLWKVRGPSKYYKRNIYLNRGKLALMVESKKWWSSGSATSIPLNSIVELREGWKTDVFNRISNDDGDKTIPGGPHIKEELCFSLIHGTGGRYALDLVANCIDDKNLWFLGLIHLINSPEVRNSTKKHEHWLQQKFKEADKDDNGALSLDEIYKLLRSLNIQMEKKHTKNLFKSVNRVSGRTRNGEEVLDSEEFIQFYNSLLKMPEVEALYDSLKNKETNLVGVEELQKFFGEEQGMINFSEEDIKKCIKKHEKSDSKSNCQMSFDGFYQFLLSDYFDVYNSNHQSNVYQDMSHPLAHYYICSSHNTYLIGHQLAGESSVEGYIRALKKGCRLVELDVWDGDDGKPIIYHGHTLTTKILLSEVLEDAIKPYSFVASDYPVILSIENHLSLPQQATMVQQFKTILGDLLLTDPAPIDMAALPSPDQLKKKIIIKAKKPQGDDVESDDEPDEQDGIDYIDDAKAKVEELDAIKFSKRQMLLPFYLKIQSDRGKKTHHKPLAPELREVVNICEGKKFASFASSFKDDICYHFPSFRENKAESLLETSAADFIKFTTRQISKIYPHGTRTGSSNLKPYLFWSVGAQAVTLNMQTEDKANFYNDVLFRDNGKCGYVLKPDILLLKEKYDPLNPCPSLTRIVTIKIISAQYLPTSDNKGDVIDPYVQLKVRGSPLDKQKSKTSTKKNNGFNPVWNETLIAEIKVPQISLLYFTVRDDSSMAKDPVLAMAGIPFRSLQHGYRHVHLTDLAGNPLSPAAIFVHVSISLP